MNNLIHKLEELGLSYKTGLLMSEKTTFGIGGCASLSVFPKSVEELEATLVAAKSAGVKYKTVGKGSNLLFSDGGYDGVLIFTEKLCDISVKGNRITALCGASTTKLAISARDISLSGFEFAYGIPGSIGGGVFMNSGAYGGQFSDVVVKSICFDANSEKEIIFEKDAHGFAYRKSMLSENPGLVLISSEFELIPGSYEEIDSKMRQNIAARKEKQPLEYKSAGSFFKRPAVGFAGKYIEDCGLKGFRVGDAQVSEKHAGFIINLGNATSDDVRSLARLVKEKVFAATGVTLEEEVEYVE